MGKMKNVYMEVVQENGLLPDGFSLDEYLHKKNLENEEWKKDSKVDSSKETSDDKTTDTTGSTT